MSTRQTIRPIHITFICLVMCYSIAGVHAATYVVNPGQSIQDAIDGATYGDTVSLAAGFHNTAEIQMKNGVSLTGESAASTAIIGAGGRVVFAENCDFQTLINDVTITQGVATNPAAYPYGGGMLIKGGSPRITNCYFLENSTTTIGHPHTTAYGGALAIINASPVLDSCLFEANSTGKGVDGPDTMAVIGGSAGNGGAVYCVDSSPTFMDCQFMGNYTGSGGRGGSTMFFMSGDGGHAGHGGAIYFNNSTPKLMNCIFKDNHTGNGGAAEFSEGGFTTGGNGGNGGGICIENQNAVILNCTFNNQHAGNGGPGMATGSNGSGGGIYIDSSSTSVTNSILWANAPDEISGTATVTYSCIRNGYTGTGNITSDPQFVNTATDDLHLKDISPCLDVGNNTAVLNEGLTTDMDGQARIIHGTVDMGADEISAFSLSISTIPSEWGSVQVDPYATTFTPGSFVTLTAMPMPGRELDHWSGDLAGNESPVTIQMDGPKVITAHFDFANDTIYVNDTATGTNTGETWENAYTDLQDALAIAQPGYQIWVAQGIYKPTDDPAKTDISFVLKNQVNLYGGFPETGDPGWEDRDPQLYPAILSGNLCDCTSYSEWTDCLIQANHIDASTVMDGFTLEEVDYIVVSADQSNMTISSCIFQNMYVYACLHLQQSSMSVKDCVLQDNTAYDHVVYTGNADHSTFSHCVFRNNNADEVMAIWASTQIEHCLFDQNTAKGIMISGSGNPTIRHCVFYGQSNSAVYFYETWSIPVITNNIFWNNGSDEIDKNQYDDIYIDRLPVINYNIIKGGFSGLGNINADPLFADPANGDFHLKSEVGRWDPATQQWVVDGVTSPGVDAGLPTDPVGDESMPHAGRVNIGLYGGTDEASLSPNGWMIADVNGDGKVNLDDLAISSYYWLEGE